MSYVRNLLFKIYTNIINFIFPPACPVCGTSVSIHGELCGDCWTAINWITNPKCAKCGYPFSSDLDLGLDMLCPTCAAGKCKMDFIRSACVYDDASRAVVLPYKHGGRVGYSLFMARACIWALRDLDIKPDIVIPVPLAYRRLVHRGYNQATLMARPIARAYGVGMDVTSVKRKYRKDMGHKNARQRAENIHNVFTVTNPDKIRGKNILLVDDVMTTGATFYELTRVLRKNGAAAVYGVTFCRVAKTV